MSILGAFRFGLSIGIIECLALQRSAERRYSGRSSFISSITNAIAQ